MGDLFEIVVLASAVALVIVLVSLAWTIGIIAVLGVARSRRRVLRQRARMAAFARRTRTVIAEAQTQVLAARSVLNGDRAA